MKRGFTQIAMQSFSLTFLAEWGDRSQIATIALAAAKNPYGVTLGGCVGHTMCTGLAVMGGRMLAARISEKTVSCFGGVIFLIFGLHSVFFES
jgi:putative Ca2+/H+ antiporter (TMEM165/GDT1 family)